MVSLLSTGFYVSKTDVDAVASPVAKQTVVSQIDFVVCT